MILIFKHFWIACIIVMFVNYFILKNETQKYIQQNTDLKTGYDKLFKAFLIFGTIPWIIMGLGDLSGMVNNVFDFLNPKALNPFVLALHLYMIIVYVMLIRWIYFKKGAEFLVQHPDFFRINAGWRKSIQPTPILIKLFFALMLLGGISAMVGMWVAAPELPVKF
jgi:hypothetical protein